MPFMYQRQVDGQTQAEKATFPGFPVGVSPFMYQDIYLTKAMVSSIWESYPTDTT